MLEHVVAGYPNEACGALGVKNSRVIKHYPTTNAADIPMISPSSTQLICYIFTKISMSTMVIIYYHSHPKSEAYPSKKRQGMGDTQQTLLHHFLYKFYPEPPYARVFWINDDEFVIEGKIELISYR